MPPSQEPQTARPRLALIALSLAVIGLGLLSRRYPVLGNYPGDMLWATLVFLAWSILLSRASHGTVTALAGGSALLVELSQLIHFDWLAKVRGTLFGRLVLGSGFDPVDLIAYAIGIGIGLFLLRLMEKRTVRA